MLNCLELLHIKFGEHTIGAVRAQDALYLHIFIFQASQVKILSHILTHAAPLLIKLGAKKLTAMVPNVAKVTCSPEGYIANGSCKKPGLNRGINWADFPRSNPMRAPNWFSSKKGLTL